MGEIFYQSNWAFESGALSALLYDSLKENGQAKKWYQKTEADTFFWCTIGMAAASILGGFLYRYNIHAPYMASAVISVGALIGAFFFEEPARAAKLFTARTYVAQNFEGLKHIFANTKIRAISIFSILIEFVGYAGLWYLYEPRLTQGKFPAVWLGTLVAGSYLIRSIGTKLIPYISRKLRLDQLPILLTLSQMAGSLLSFWETQAGAIGSVYFRKFSDGLRKPILARMQNEEIASEYRATSLSAIVLLYNLLVAAVGPAIGILMDRIEPSKTMGLFFFVSLLVVLPAAQYLQKQIKPQ